MRKLKPITALLLCVCMCIGLFSSCSDEEPGETPAPPVIDASATLLINEYSTDDCTTYADAQSKYVAWVELYNTGASEVSLDAFSLGAGVSSSKAWQLPAAVVPAGGYVVVFLSGQDKAYAEGGEIHAPFTLKGTEGTLSLYNKHGKTVDECVLYELFSNVTCGRPAAEPSTWLFFPKATPGAANTVSGFDSIDAAGYPSSKIVVINEAAAVRVTLGKAPDGKSYSRGELYDYYELEDFIELRNMSKTDVSLAEYKISKSARLSKAVSLPDYTLSPGEYAVIYCANEESFDEDTGEIYIDMGLNRYGEDIYLIDNNGVVCDSIYTGYLTDGVSAGRASEYDSSVFFFTKVTPGSENPSQGLGAACPKPVVNNAGGYVQSGTLVTLSAPEGYSVYYTLDGSYPDTDSELYTSPVEIKNTLTLRAICSKEGYLASEDISVSFLTASKHSYPVICLSSDDENFFSSKTGILADGNYITDEFPYTTANYWQDWERPIRFDYIDETGTQVLSFGAGAKVFGQYSRAMDQKSLSINLKDKYGPKEICYPFFEEDSVNVVSSLVLRNGGQDGKYAHLRDAFVREVVYGEIDVETMAYRPVIVYINGEYWGIYDLRERVNEDYIATHRGLDADNIDMIKGSSIVLEGSYDEWDSTYDFIKNNSMANPENYAAACELVDIDSLMNFWICEIFFGNTDYWNIKYYRERSGGKWRWVLYDLDWGLWPTTYYSYNMFSYALSEHSAGFILRRFMENPDFKAKFISEFERHLDTTFETQRMLGILDEMTEELRPEMGMHIERWGDRNDDNKLTCTRSMNSWESYLNTLRSIVEDANAETRADMEAFF